MPMPVATETTGNSPLLEEGSWSQNGGPSASPLGWKMTYEILQSFMSAHHKENIGRPRGCIVLNYAANQSFAPAFVELAPRYLHGYSATTEEDFRGAVFFFEDETIWDATLSMSGQLPIPRGESEAPTLTMLMRWPNLADPAMFDPLEISSRLASLKGLRDGWADGMQHAGAWGEAYGRAPTSDGLDWLASQFAQNYARKLPRPYLFPTPEGDIQAEWSLGANEVSLEIDLAGHSAVWHCLDLHTGLASEQPLDLNNRNAWEWLTRMLRQLESMPE